MEVVRTISETRQHAGNFRLKGSLGLVPTMGSLHYGHISLMLASIKECDFTAVSIFVNPTQFGEGEDFSTYPRDEAGDLSICEEEEVDLVFIPDVDEMYKPDASVSVNEDMMSRHLCGRDRPMHFNGVLTVVAKLFNILQPDISYFGMKDYQQGKLIQRMVRDLNFPIEVKLMPTERDLDGVATSSRNKYLSEENRAGAVVLSQSLEIAEGLYDDGERDSLKIKAAIIVQIERAPFARIVYVEICDAENLEPVVTIERPTLIALAVRFGNTRLIDNTVIGNTSLEE